jgi:hypothetical protein
MTNFTDSLSFGGTGIRLKSTVVDNPKPLFINAISKNLNKKYVNTTKAIKKLFLHFS